MAEKEDRTLWIHTAWRYLPAAVVFALVCFLSVLGLLMLNSIGRSGAGTTGGIFFKQVTWFGLALAALGAAVWVDLEHLRKWLPVMLLTAAVLLIAVLIPGVGLKVNGARRWLDLGPMNMQVSDAVKIFYLYLLAHYLASNRRNKDSFIQGFVVPIILVALPFGLIMLQPDYGTAFLFALVGGALIFLSGVRMLYLLPTALLGLSVFATLIFYDPVRLKRITSFMDVEGNRSEGTYQLWQGILGFGTGGVDGVGLGNGRQQLAFLPEAHTDFIFPIIGEELGFITTCCVLLAFGLLFTLGWWQLRRAPNAFQFLLCSGALMFIVFQALINMGVSTGCLPTKGMSLPFVSYGGSNLVATFLLLGIFLNGCLRWNRPTVWKARDIES